MNKIFFYGKWLLLIAVLLLAQCKVPYDAPVKPSDNHFLVVEGYINAAGLTSIDLTRTRNITWGDTAAYTRELNAKVVIEDNYNDVFPLNENGNGNYSGFYYLPSNGNYRLRITTSNNKEYVSDFVPCKQSPTIDEIGWKFKDGGVQVFVNTHDPQNNTNYYRWSYTETWEFHSQYYSTLEYINQPVPQVINRTTPVFVCYQNNNSSAIFLGSSKKLKEDIIHEAPLQLIPNHDKKISVLYSTLVTQYALDSLAYNYWDALKGNTENIGSIFGTQPNQTKGNIHCTSDSSETVIGYIGAGIVQQERIFISNSSMPPGWNQLQNCTEYTVPLDSIAFYFSGNIYIPISTVPPGSPTPTGYFSASGSCVDCTLSGSPVKPGFWP